MIIKGRWDKLIDEGREFVNAISKRYARIAITGVPGVGKTTLTRDIPSTWHTDVLKNRWRSGWEDQTDAIVARGREKSIWVFEGVTVARALREGLPADAAIFVTSAFNPNSTPRRDALAIAVSRWMNEAMDLNYHIDLYELHLLHPNGQKPYE